MWTYKAAKIFDWEQNSWHVMLCEKSYNGRAFVVAKEVFHHRSDDNLKQWEWLNNDKQFFLFKFNYINTRLYLEYNVNHLKLRYTDPCNFFTKCALVIQPNTLVVAKDSNISHHFNVSINSPTVIFPIIQYTPNLIVPHKWTQMWWLVLPI